MKNTKIRLLAELLILLVSILMFAQATYAYFSSQSKASATITAGNVEILLSESAVKHDDLGNLVRDTESPKIFGSASGTVHDYGIVFPGQHIFKDPTIQNIGTNDAYIAAKMSITDGDGDIHRLIGYDNYDEIDLTTLFGGGFFDEPAHFGEWNGIENVTHNDSFAMVQVPHRSQGRYDVYFFLLSPTKRGDSVTLFDSMYFYEGLSNEEMREFEDLRIDIYAFGVQTSGFGSCYDAMLGALPEHFADLQHSAP